MQLSLRRPSRRSMWIVIPVVVIALLLLLWFVSHRTARSTEYLDKVSISGFDKLAQKEFASNGSGDYPPSATAYFIGPSGNAVVNAPAFTVTRVDPPEDNPKTNHILLDRGEAPRDCSIFVSRLYPPAAPPGWAHLSGKQESEYRNGKSQLLEVGIDCGD